MPTPTRQVLSIDFGELRPRIESQAAAEGLRPGPWVKRQLEQMLPPEDTPTSMGGIGDEPVESHHRSHGDVVKFTARLSAQESQALAKRAAAAGLSQAELIGRLVLDDDARVAPNSVEWTAALTHSNHCLVGVARSLTALGRGLSSTAGLSATERSHVLAVTQTVREHLELVSRQLHELRSTRRSRAKDLAVSATPSRKRRHSMADRE